MRSAICDPLSSIFNLQSSIFNLFVLSVLSVQPCSAFIVRRDTLPNGLALLTSEDRHLPMVNLQFSVRAGSFNDPPGQEGVANLTRGLLIMGTKTRSSEQISQEIEFVGGDIGTERDADHSTVSIQILARDLDRALDLLADVVLNPVFSDSELTKLRQLTVSTIRYVKDLPAVLLDQEFTRLLFGTHPYGRPGMGFDSTVSRITRAQIVDFYNTWFAPNNSYIVAVGDFSAESLRVGLAARFGTWTRRPVPGVAAPPVPPITSPRGKVINKPDMNQTRINIGHEGIPEGTADAYPCRMMNFMLGGSGISSRIGTAIRGERGLAYDARSGFDRRLHGGIFQASTQTRTDSAQAAIGLILQQLRDMREKGVTAAELQRTKEFYLGNFPLQYESSRDKLGALDRIELFHLGLDYLDRFADNVKAVTEADILKAARDHIFPDRYLLVVIGNLTEKDIVLPEIEWIKE